MGMVNSKDTKKKIDEATSNSSLSNLRYVITEKPKWKVFRKREIRPIPAYQTSLKPQKGCPCGNNGPCKQKITPKGVTIHYPQKKKKFSASFGSRRIAAKPEKGYFSRSTPTSAFNVPTAGIQAIGSSNARSSRVAQKVKIVRPRKFPTWRLDKLKVRPYYR